MVSKKRNSFDAVLDIVLFIGCLGMVLPFFTTLFPTSYVRIGSSLFFVVYYLLTHFANGKPIKTWIWITFVLMIICCFMPYLVGYPVIANRYLGMSFVFIAPIIYDFYRERNRIKELKRLLVILSVIGLFTLFTTYYNLLMSPYISRKAKGSGEVSVELARKNIGGYGFIYAVSSVSVLFLFCSIRMKKPIMKLVFFTAWVLSFLLTIKSNFFTAMFILIIGSLIVFIFAHKSRLKIVCLILITMSLFVLLLSSQTIVDYLYSVLPTRVTSFLSLDANIFTSIFEEFTSDRLPTLNASIDAFIDYPLLGLCFSGNISYSGKFLAGFGQHSFILDSFAIFGLIPGLLIIYVTLRPLLCGCKKSMTITFAIFVCMFILYVFDNITDSITLVFGLVFPLIRDSIEEMEMSESEKSVRYIVNIRNTIHV